MPKEILIVKNIPREGPGLLEELLLERRIPFVVVDLNEGDEFPAPRNFGAVVVLGGPASANDDIAIMRNELCCVRETVDAKIPYLGICLGLQVLVKAAGGSVVRNPVREVGFRGPDGERFTIELTAAGARGPLFAQLENTLRVFHIHGETVELAPDMTLLGTGKFCRNQAVKVGENAYGLQCHFELNAPMFENWLAEDSDLLKLDAAQLRRDFESIRDEYTRVGRQLLQNFLRIAGY